MTESEKLFERFDGKMVRGFGYKTGELRIGRFVRVDLAGAGIVIADRDGKLGLIRDAFLDERACKGCGRVEVPELPDGRVTCSADCEALHIQNEWKKRELLRKAEHERRDRIYRGTR